MHNIKFNKNIFKFFKNNKIKLLVLGLSIIVINSTSCQVKNKKTKENNNIKTTLTNKKDLKESIIKNIKNITVTKDTDKYIIEEDVYIETPINNKEQKKQVYIGSQQYCITFEEAKELNLTKLLESKITNSNQKIK